MKNAEKLVDPVEDAEARYVAARGRRELLLEEWERLGRPVLTKGGHRGDRDIPHPLIKMLSEADLLCDRLGKTAAGKRREGRPVGATSAPDREPPRVKLAAVPRQ